MASGGGSLPIINLYCISCGWKTTRVYKFEEGFGNCPKCGSKLVKTPKTKRHIVMNHR